jgi:excisionase family DNA binding protein
MTPRVAEIRTSLKRAMAQFIKRDHYLLEFDVNERSVSHRLALYLQAAFPKSAVDCEYNRDLAYTKELEPPTDPIEWDDTEAKTVFPDIIVHKRGSNHHNMLVVEMKKRTDGDDADFDRDKLTSFVEQYRYRKGAFETFTTGPSGKFNTVEWFPKPVPMVRDRPADARKRRDALNALPEFCTVEEVAKYLRISRGLAYEQVRSGKIESVRVGRLLRVRREFLAGLGRRQTW